jgi:hypothetical protein
MINKRQVRRDYKRLQNIKTWQLIILLILAVFLSATLLRLNNIGMVERRTAVINADEAGDNKVIQSRLYDLQRYVAAHMNSDMGKGVYLESSYKRAAKVAYEAAASDTNSNGNIYKKAVDTCQPKFTSFSYTYTQCIINELAKYPAGSSLNSSVNLPSTDLYRYNYVSPVWSPDFAGWSVIICVVILIMILARLLGVIILKIMLRRRTDNI